MDNGDSTLLKEFAMGADHGAFRLLVERYQNLVFSAALRRVGQRALAEEISQEVFLLLAEKAHMLVRRSTLAGWLHETTLKLASNKMRSEMRRVRREQQYVDEADFQSPGEEIPAEARAIIDLALARLRDAEREAVILRFFQGLEFGDVARIQGSSTEAVRKRVHRALEKLSVVFRRKGVAATGSAVAAILAGSTVPAPAALLPAIAGAAIAPAAPGAFFSLLYFLITMNKIQTAVIAAVIIAVPLGIQQASKVEMQKQVAARQQQAAQPPPPPRGEVAMPAAKATNPHGEKHADARAAAKAAFADVMRRNAADLLPALDGLVEKELKIRAVQAREKAAELSKALGVDAARAEAIANLAQQNTKRSVERSATVMKDLVAGKTITESEEIALFDGIEGILSREENERYKEWSAEDENAEMRKLAESMAMQDLSYLQEVVPLEGERRQKAFDIFLEENEELWLPSDKAATNGADVEAKFAAREKARLGKLAQILTESEMKAYRLTLKNDTDK